MSTNTYATRIAHFLLPICYANEIKCFTIALNQLHTDLTILNRDVVYYYEISRYSYNFPIISQMNEQNTDALWLATYDLQNFIIRKEVRCNGSYRKLMVIIYGCS